MLSSLERGHAGVVLRALDDHLVGADAGHHVVDAVAPLVQVALDLQRGEPVGDDPDPPARPVGPGAEVAIGDDLRRRLVLLPLAERADRGSLVLVRLGLEVVGPLGPLVRDDHPAADDRVFSQLGHGLGLRAKLPVASGQLPVAVADQRCCVTINACDSASRQLTRHWQLGCTDHSSSHLPHDPLEVGAGDGELEDALAGGAVEAGLALEELDVEPDRVAGLPAEPAERRRPARGSGRWPPRRSSRWPAAGRHG